MSKEQVDDSGSVRSRRSRATDPNSGIRISPILLAALGAVITVLTVTIGTAVNVTKELGAKAPMSEFMKLQSNMVRVQERTNRCETELREYRRFLERLEERLRSEEQRP